MVDYSNEGFQVPIIVDDEKGYALVNPGYYPVEDGIEKSSKYFVYLLHPRLGSSNFILEPTDHEDDPFDIDGGAIWLNHPACAEAIKIIIDEIQSRRLLNSLNLGQ